MKFIYIIELDVSRLQQICAALWQQQGSINIFFRSSDFSVTLNFSFVIGPTRYTDHCNIQFFVNITVPLYQLFQGIFYFNK